MNAQSFTDNSPIRSEFSNDEDFAELLEMFTAELPERMRNMKEKFAAQDVPGLTTLAHQMKGAGGGYGFPQLSEISARLEQACKDNAEQQIKQDLDEVLHCMNRIQL